MSVPAEPRLTEQAPFVWVLRAYHRAGLPPLAWVFIAAAVVVGVLRLLSLIGTPTLALLIGGMLFVVASTATAALPAALLARVPDAPRRMTLLFVGLALGALVVLVRSVLQPLGLDQSTAAPIAEVVYLADVMGLLLIGVGLLRLRSRGTAWQPLTILLAAAYFLGSIAPALLLGALVIDPLIALRSLIATLALAFVHAVAAGGWLDRESPRTFWGLLAVAAPIYLFQVAVSAVVTLLSSPGQTAIFPLLSPLMTLLSALVALAALLAYARYAPTESNPRR